MSPGCSSYCYHGSRFGTCWRSCWSCRSVRSCILVFSVSLFFARCTACVAVFFLHLFSFCCVDFTNLCSSLSLHEVWSEDRLFSLLGGQKAESPRKRIGTSGRSSSPIRIVCMSSFRSCTDTCVSLVCSPEFSLPCSKITQFEQDLKHLHHELRSKEVYLSKVKPRSLSSRKILELEEELKVVGNNMKSLEVSEQEVAGREFAACSAWLPLPDDTSLIEQWYSTVSFVSFLGYSTWRKLRRTNPWFDSTSQRCKCWFSSQIKTTLRREFGSHLRKKSDKKTHQTISMPHPTSIGWTTCWSCWTYYGQITKGGRSSRR